SSRRRHTRFSRDWCSDVCSSDLLQRRHATLLDDLETWAAGRAIAFTFRNRAISVGRVFGRCWLDLEYHSLAILTRVNRHHRRTRHMQILRHAAETPIETDGIVTQLQVT